MSVPEYMEVNNIADSTRLLSGYAYEYERVNGYLYSVDYISTTGFSTYRNGFKNPRYKSQITKRQNATTPLEGIDVYRVKSSSETDKGESPSPLSECRVEYRHPANISQTAKTYDYCRWYLHPALPSDLAVKNLNGSKAENEAASLFHLKANKAFTDWEAGVFLGELKELARLIRSTAERLLNLIFRFKRDAFAIARNLRHSIQQMLEQLSNLWLEFSFAWKPLQNDIQSMIDAALEMTKEQKAIRAIAKDVISHTSVWTNVGSAAAGAKYLRTTTNWVEVMYFGSVSASFGSDSQMRKKFGFSPENFAPTIYELIPWSFLIDYFVNLNAVIAAMSNVTVNMDWTSKTVRKGSTVRYRNPQIRKYADSVYPNSDIVVTSWSPQTAGFEKKYVERSRIDSVPIPSLTFSLPDSLVKYINIGALFGASTATRDLIRGF